MSIFHMEENDLHVCMTLVSQQSALCSKTAELKLNNNRSADTLDTFQNIIFNIIWCLQTVNQIKMRKHINTICIYIQVNQYICIKQAWIKYNEAW